MGKLAKSLSKSYLFRKTVLIIFATVGTHEQQFNRLIEAVDGIADCNDVFIQTGYSTLVPKHCEYAPMIGYDDMVKKIVSADIVITHGGPGSIMLALEMGKVPIAVPRLKAFGEHVNDHQLAFCTMMNELGRCSLLLDVSQIREVVQSSLLHTEGMRDSITQNRRVFEEGFTSVLEKLVNASR